MFVRYFGDLIVHLWQGRRGRVSGSEVISCSHLFQYICWNRLCVDGLILMTVFSYCGEVLDVWRPIIKSEL